jgi:hypothetical protein
VIKYKLRRKNYDDLRGDDFAAPRYLAVLLVPAELEAWIAHNAEHIALFNSCYWQSLKEAEATDNEDSVTVYVPLAQRLTSAKLREMMDRASHGEWL